MNKMQNFDVLDAVAKDKHVKGHGKNFKPLIAAGSWIISGFHYGKSKCACCGRPILHVLHLKNESHVSTSQFDETIEIGIVCGPKVFIESCVGFYSDPEKEWARQHQAWKDYINYIILCVKHEKLWKLIPEELRMPIDTFLQEGYKAQSHSGGWWLVKDAKKRYLKSQTNNDVVPNARILYYASRNLLMSAKRQNLIPGSWDMTARGHTDAATNAYTVEFQIINNQSSVLT